MSAPESGVPAALAPGPGSAPSEKKPFPKYDRRRLVLVQWDDSRQPRSHWQFICQLPPPAVVKCCSVGFVVHDTEDLIGLAPNIADSPRPADMQASGIIIIPKRSVTAMDELTEKTSGSDTAGVA